MMDATALQDRKRCQRITRVGKLAWKRSTRATLRLHRQVTDGARGGVV
jgi:hypothetical protein